MRCSQLVSGKGGRARKCRNQAQNGGYCWQHGEQSYASSTYHQNGAGYEEIYNYQTPSAGSSFGKFLENFFGPGNSRSNYHQSGGAVDSIDNFMNSQNELKGIIGQICNFQANDIGDYERLAQLNSGANEILNRMSNQYRNMESEKKRIMEAIQRLEREIAEGQSMYDRMQNEIVDDRTPLNERLRQLELEYQKQINDLERRFQDEIENKNREKQETMANLNTELQAKMNEKQQLEQLLSQISGTDFIGGTPSSGRPLPVPNRGNIRSNR